MVVISTGLPNCREGRLNPVGAVDPRWLREATQAAEDLGYHSVWLNEFLTTDPATAANVEATPGYYDPLTTIAYLSAHTTTIRFLPSVLVLPMHEPILLTRQLQALDALSAGRVALGVGLGGTADAYRSLRGSAAGGVNRGTMMSEYLAAVRLLWESPVADFAGRYVQFEGVARTARPVQERLPVYVAGGGDAMIERVAAHGDVWVDALETPERVAAVRERLAGAAPAVTVARQFNVSIAGSSSAALENVRASLPGARKLPVATGSGPAPNANVFGTPDEVYEILVRYRDAGATEIAALFYSPTVESAVAQMELFQREVTPRLAG